MDLADMYSPSARIRKLAKAYNHLLYAEKLIPREERGGELNFHGARVAIAELMAQEYRPRTVADVRRFPYSNVGLIARCLLGRVLEAAAGVEDEDPLPGYDMLRRVGALKVLAAPVETPAELAAWLRAQKPVAVS